MTDMASGVGMSATGWLSNLIGRSWIVRTPTAVALGWYGGSLALMLRNSPPFGWLLALGTAMVLTVVAVLAALACDEPIPRIWGRGLPNYSRRVFIGLCIGQAVVGAICILWFVLEGALGR